MKNILVTVALILVGALGAGIFYLWQTRDIEVPVAASPVGGEGVVSPPTFSLDEAPSSSLRGQILSLTGDTYWISRIATEPATLTSSTIIQQGESVDASDSGKLVVAFGQAGKITLSNKAKIDVIQTLPVNLVFSQIRGSVIYEASQDSPFSVRSYHLLVTLHTGSMTVDVNEKIGSVTLVISQGNATVAYNDERFTSQTYAVKEGQRFVFDDSTQTGRIY